MKNEIIAECKDIIQNKTIYTQACYSESRVPDAEVSRYEYEAHEAIKHATDKDLDEAYEIVKDCVGEDEENTITAELVLREVGDAKATSIYESLMLSNVCWSDN